jgi:hypothetical protein
MLARFDLTDHHKNSYTAAIGTCNSRRVSEEASEAGVGSSWARQASEEARTIARCR